MKYHVFNAAGRYIYTVINGNVVIDWSMLD